MVLLPACRWDKETLSYHTIGDKYVRAVASAAGCLPLMLPSLGGYLDPEALVRRVDGIVLTGSPSNVHPEHYGEAASERAEPYDTWRDDITLPLIRAAIGAGCPLLAICRGMQEMNVALGGTLFPKVHELDGRMDHRRPPDVPVDEQYGPRHDVALTPGGLLATWLDTDRIRVNSLHHQGIAEPAPDLRVEATAEDGTIEAVSLPRAPGFVFGVQWHPEYKPAESPVSQAIFRAFAEAAHARAGAARGG
jgi:putative glutamine amidotransferase